MPAYADPAPKPISADMIFLAFELSGRRLKLDSLWVNVIAPAGARGVGGAAHSGSRSNASAADWNGWISQ